LKKIINKVRLQRKGISIFIVTDERTRCFEPKVMKNKVFKRKGKFYAYMVECCDGTYYTGYTPDIEKRIALHNIGRGAKYTRDRKPVKLVWSREYKYFKKAFLEEKRIKALTREQKEKLVNERK